MSNAFEKYTKMQVELANFYRENKKEIEQERLEVEFKLVKLFVDRELRAGNMVWCRNGAVCSEATPCEMFKCNAKESHLDIANGCAKCNTFQVTYPSLTWSDARHINFEEDYSGE